MNKEEQQSAQVLARLRDPKTIRLQAQRLFNMAQHNQLEHFTLNMEKMASTGSFVIEVIKEQYPDFNIPYHSRWRHFEENGTSRINTLLKKLSQPSNNEWGRRLYELAIISVFLDAGAGTRWHYFDKETHKKYTRSEGLALASLALYQNGVFSNDPNQPLRVDGPKLKAFSEQDLLEGFQVTADNPLEGVQGRIALLNRLGETIQDHSQYFGAEGRLGNFYDYVRSLSTQNTLSATTIFHAVLSAFNNIWPVRLTFHNIPLGDVGMHKALKTTTLGSEYIPFHKLSQWLTYSLIEPLEQTGFKINDLDQLTGLPEYRNGGLFIDMGLLQVKDKNLLLQAQHPDCEAIIEWRALTVSLLDEIALFIRKELHKCEHSLPLAKILQGGTWEAGRRIAKIKRAQGIPPIQIISDGTIF